MAEEEIGEEERDHGTFLMIFYPALERVSLPADAASKQNGHFNTAWETHWELTGHAYLVHSAALCLTKEQKGALEQFLNKIANLPADAISPEGINTRTVDGDIASMKPTRGVSLMRYLHQLCAC